MGNLVRQARRRILSNQLFAQGVNAGSAALAAFILLLLLGTQILSWPVALAIPLAAALFGIYRVKRRLPSPYAVAQLIDQRLGLADHLSTALFFSEVDPSARVAPDIRRAQFEEAGRLAQSVDARHAVPYTMPRAVYLLAGLALLAGSLFGLRYGLSRRLDLRQPLASFLPESLTGGKPVHQANSARRNPRQTPETPDDGSAAANQDQQNRDPEETSPDVQPPNEALNEAMAKMDAKSITIQKPGEQDDNEMASDDADSEGEASGKDGEESQNGDGKSGKGEKSQNGEKQDSKNASESSSLLSKMKDAFQNLLSKAKSQQNQQTMAQQGKDQKSAPAKSQQGSKQNGKDGQPQNGSQKGDAQEGEDGQEAKSSENSQQGKGQGKSDSEQPSKQPGSGIGSQDGEKAIRNAEQLAAMGKISEILGKRSATISGEATVEVQTTSQQLRTPYAQKGAQHTQGGAEISRDEVPVALQPYVQQYFEQVRKQSETAGKK
ncbi:MAG: hypothetical protein NTW28_30590 [Candidatus Solibacter sp.]|nr:hypothetical protein [Candidatus Solibacter sp.]